MVRQVLQHPNCQYAGRFSDLVHWFGTYLLGRSQPILGRLLRTRADVAPTGWPQAMRPSPEGSTGLAPARGPGKPVADSLQERVSPLDERVPLAVLAQAEVLVRLDLAGRIGVVEPSMKSSSLPRGRSRSSGRPRARPHARRGRNGRPDTGASRSHSPSRGGRAGPSRTGGPRDASCPSRSLRPRSGPVCPRTRGRASSRIGSRPRRRPTS